MGDVTKLQEELFAARQAYAVAQRSVSELTGQLQDSKEENSALQSQLRQHQQLQTESRQNAQKVDELEGFLAGKDAENKRLKGRNQLLQEEVTELRSQCDSKNLEASQAQGSAALHKSRLDEQAAQILLLKRQLLEMEDEVAAAESDAQAARAALADAPSSAPFAEPETTASAAAQEEVSLLKSTNAELHNRAAYLEEQLIERDRQLQHMAEASDQAAPKTSGRSVQTYMLRNQRQKAENALKEENGANRLQQEVSVLANSLKEAEMMGDMWQAQAQSALGQIEKLKEMLSEGAAWEGEKADRPKDCVVGVEHAATVTAVGTQDCDGCAKLQQLVLKHSAEAAELDLVVRSLLAECLRGQEACCQIGRVSLPALYAIESRLMELTS